MMNNCEMDNGRVEKELLSPEDLCGYLNFSITTIYKIMKQEDFPRIRIGRKLFVRKNELEEWIQNHKERGEK